MSELGLLADAQPTDDFATIPDVPIVPVNSINNPNQTRSGVTRGIQQLGSDKVYSDGGNNQIIVEDTTVPRVLMGNHATLGEGLYVTKNGFDVKTNTDPANFIFNSSQNVFKIVSSGTSSITIPTVTASTVFTVTIPHHLSFAPIPLVYVSDGTFFTPTPFHTGVSASGLFVGTNLLIFSQMDATNLYIQAVCGQSAGNPSASGTFPIKYYLLQETVN